MSLRPRHCVQVLLLLQDAPEAMLPANAMDDLIAVGAVAHDCDSVLCLFQVAMRRKMTISMQSQRLILETAMRSEARLECALLPSST
jgi:hypothetical protein